MNIQFMTAEKNGIPTGETNWKGEVKYTYMPNWAEMIENASCEEEADAIREAEKVITRTNRGFAFEIVFTTYGRTFDSRTGKHINKWQVLQYPWYRTFEGVYDTKEQMMERINELNKAIDRI